MRAKIAKNSSMEPQISPVDPPKTVKQLSNKCTYTELNTLLNVVEFTRSLNVSKNQIEHLTFLTKEQASKLQNFGWSNIGVE